MRDPDDEEVEDLIDALRAAVDEDPMAFTPWEREFLDRVEDQNESGHLTESQVEKLREIYDERL